MIAFGCMLHRDYHFASTTDQVHSASHSFYHLAWDDPVCQVSCLRYLETSEYTDIHMSASDHAERGR